MTGLCFVDANVFVYADDPREPGKRAVANDWLTRLWSDRTGRTSAQALSEYFVTVTRKLPGPVNPDVAWQRVRSLAAWEPQAVDFDVLQRAFETHQRYSISWWDSLIVAAAQLQHCVLLLTEDLQDGAVFDSVTVRDPFRLSVEEALATYGPARTKPRYARRPSAMRG